MKGDHTQQPDKSLSNSTALGLLIHRLWLWILSCTLWRFLMEQFWGRGVSAWFGLRGLSWVCAIESVSGGCPAVSPPAIYCRYATLPPPPPPQKKRKTPHPQSGSRSVTTAAPASRTWMVKNHSSWINKDHFNIIPRRSLRWHIRIRERHSKDLKLK